MSALHTPGPWTFEPSTAIHNPIVRLPDGGEVEVITDNDADAHLIAAAPDLLAAILRCEQLLAAQKWATDGPRHALAPEALLLLDLRAAIAKANGEQA